MNKIIFVTIFLSFFLISNCLNIKNYCEFKDICIRTYCYVLQCHNLNVNNTQLQYDDDWNKLYVFNGYNSEIPFLSQNVFSRMKSLVKINCDDCKIKIIEKYAFEGLQNLRSIQLTNNPIQELAAFTFSEVGKKPNSSPTEIDRILSLVHGLNVSLNHNKIVNIEDFCFKNPLIRKIDLSHNYLKVVKKNTFEGATSLEILHLENNLIENIEKMSFFVHSNLSELHLNNNKLKEIESDTFVKTNSLVSLYLKNNSINSIEKDTFSNNAYLKIVDLSNNKLIKIENGIFCKLKSLTELRLNNNLIQYIEDNSVCSEKMILIDLENNHLTNIKNSTFNKLESLRTIYLDNNLIENIEKGSFLKNSKLDAIYLNNNKLKEFDDVYMGYISEISSHIDLSNNILESVHFGNKHILDTLNLSSGNIKDLHYDTFEGLDLKTLILTDNKIEKFDIHVIYPMPDLRTLYIDGNKLSEIDYEDPKFQISFIDLTYNNWNCTYLKKMIKYCNEKNITYIISRKPNSTSNVAGIGCTENNYDRETDNNLENALMKSEIYESVENAIYHFNLLVLGILGIFTILTVSINIWIYIFYKYKIRSRMYKRTLADHSLIDMKDMQ